MNADDTAKPQRAMNPESGCAREMTLEEYVKVLPAFHLARRKFEHIRFLVCESQLDDSSIRQELRNILGSSTAITPIEELHEILSQPQPGMSALPHDWQTLLKRIVHQARKP